MVLGVALCYAGWRGSVFASSPALSSFTRPNAEGISNPALGGVAAQVTTPTLDEAEHAGAT
jgi:hypothetical protein